MKPTFTPDLSTRIATPGKLEVARLELLCDYLDQLNPQLFSLAVIVDKRPCGTVGCVVGHMPNVFPDLAYYQSEAVKIRGSSAWTYGLAAECVLGIPDRLASDLLYLEGQRHAHKSLPCCSDKSTPKEVAAMLRHFIALTKSGQIEGLVAGE